MPMSLTPPVMPFMTADVPVLCARGVPAGRPAGRRLLGLCLTKTAKREALSGKDFFSVEFFQQQRRCLRRCPILILRIPLLVHLPLRDGDCCILYAEAADVAVTFGAADELQKNIAADVVALPICSFQHFRKEEALSRSDICPLSDSRFSRKVHLL